MRKLLMQNSLYTSKADKALSSKNRLKNLSLLVLTISILMIAGCATSPSLPTTSSSSSVVSGQHSTLQQGMPEIDKKGHIAYIEEQGYGASKVSILYLIRPDGSERQAITQVQGSLFSPTWSFDGTALAYSVQLYRRRPQIFIYQLDNGSVRQAVDRDGLSLSPSFSPDGTQLLFSSSEAGDSDIYLTDLATKKIRRFTISPNIEVQPSYAADGKSFIYTSDKDSPNNPHIYRYDFATGDSTQIQTEGYAANAQLSIDGSKLGYLNGSEATVMDMASNEVILSESTGLDEPARFSPSGKYVIYPKAYQNGSQLIIRALDNPKEQQVIYKTEDLIRSPVWSHP